MIIANQNVVVLCLFEPSTLISPQVEKESAPKDLKESCRKSRFSTLKEMVIHLVTSLQAGDLCIVLAFISIYQRFVTIQQVLDLLFKRYAYFCPACEEDEQVKNAICTILNTWIEKFPEDFCQTSELTILKQVKNYLVANILCSDLLVRVHALLIQLQAAVASDSEASTEEAL
ncbi:hypothetical protein A6R68_17916, partial [Neotoma lepida]